MATETISSVLGWISIATWVVVYSPQIWENYKLKSGEGLSVPFVMIWLLGDIMNLAGAMIAGLLPTVILLAAWYTLCDTILLVQIYYYRWLHSRKRSLFVSEDGARIAEETRPEDTTPLLTGDNETHVAEKESVSFKKEILVYSTAIGFVVATGIVAWAVSEHTRGEKGGGRPGRSEEVIEWRSQIMGWISAVLYLGSRVPQILKNFETKCEGLSPGLFIFSIMGNATYAGSILVAGMTGKHLLINLSWLAGSALTIFLDVFVLGQFVRYRRQAVAAAASEL
ncbi:PQ-loop-domain-containing protein [Vararia minispora EC-137]|uniref:PQ-loop-domain-containing protein n=1 Tax=Vararia minispora EC-137 TaxID=1314806 RepID=A0ACB8QHF8_9AGAM|nr:PQ-loop-domain-containing protein [Vararia minispora EC-137]